MSQVHQVSPPRVAREAWALTRPDVLGTASLVVFWGWASAMGFMGRLRWDHLALAVFATLLACGPTRSKRLLHGLLPLGLVALSYDAMRFVEQVGLSESTVHVCDLRNFEARFFGITSGGTRMTVHDWLAPRATPWLDVLCAIPYGAFLAVVFGYCVLLFFRNFEAEQHFAWAFLALNLIGFTTYHLYPAAPPWYFHQYGCRVDLTAAASAGPNLTRVDAMLGIPYFAGLYGRASDVFGAFPSLHVGYPTLMLAVGWRVHGAVGRSLLVLFLSWMAFSAVYLDHHWIIDLIGGASYALVAALAVRRFAPLFAARRTSSSEGDDRFTAESPRAVG